MKFVLQKRRLFCRLSLESRIQLSLLEKYHCNSNVQKGNKNDEDLILAQSALKA